MTAIGDDSKKFQPCELTIIKIKPAKKVIDLSCIVGSGIDCEFDDNAGYWNVGRLIAVGQRGYISGYGNNWDRCRIRQSPHVHWWNGGDKCPLPEGLSIKLYFIVDDALLRSVVTNDYRNFRHFDWRKVIGFEVLGVADNSRYEWKEEE